MNESIRGRTYHLSSLKTWQALTLVALEKSFEIVDYLSQCFSLSMSGSVLHFLKQTKQFFRNSHLICIIHFVHCMFTFNWYSLLSFTEMPVQCFAKEFDKWYVYQRSHATLKLYHLPNICVNTTKSDRQYFDTSNLQTCCEVVDFVLIWFVKNKPLAWMKTTALVH